MFEKEFEPFIQRIEKALSGAQMLRDNGPRIEFDHRKAAVLDLRDTATHVVASEDVKLARRFIWDLQSTLDQVVYLQPFGSVAPDAESDLQFDLGLPIVLAPGARMSVPINLDDLWHPIMGLSAYADTAPTAGTIRATACVQQWSSAEGEE